MKAPGRGEHHDGLALEDLVAGHVDPFVVATGTENDIGDALAFAVVQFHVVDSWSEVAVSGCSICNRNRLVKLFVST